MEPTNVTMIRDANNKESGSEQDKERFPGDGMEAHTLQQHIRTVSTSYKISKTKILTPTTTKKSTSTLNNSSTSNSLISNVFATPDQTLTGPSYEETLQSLTDLQIANDTLQTQLNLFKQQNDQLTEQKMKLSQQLGIQTQVNNEVKNLLVASIGEDLQQKYQRLIEDKTQVDLELSHLRNSMEEDREEVEQAMIQADVWRSKFLASRVMGDELSRWKSVLYYKYRDSHTALQNLLHEHSKIRALNNATRRGLVRFAELLACKDPSLDTESPLTTIDVALMNTDLVESLVTILEENTNDEILTHRQVNSSIKPKELNDAARISTSRNHKDIYIEASELTPAEQLAQEIVLNPDIQTDELVRMRHDYLAHNRISHFLSTNYQVTFNCCAYCKGPIYIV